MKKTAFLFVFVLMIFICVKSYAGEKNAYLDFGFWNASLNIDAEEGKNSTTVDAINVLGVDDDKSIFTVSAGLNITGPFGLFGDFYSFSSSGSSELSQNITFNEITFTKGSDVKGKFRHDYFKGGLRYRFVENDNYYFNLRGGLNYNKMKVEISDSSQKTTGSVEVPFPFVGIELGGDLDYGFEWGGIVDGFAFSFDDDSVSYLDFNAFIKYRVNEIFNLKTGYKYENVDCEVDDDEYDADTSGFYISANLTF